MPAEQFKNNAFSYLDQTIDAEQTDIAVVNVVPFPSVPQFRILIDNEIMLVTDILGGHFTVIRAAEVDNGGGIAASHTAGTLITHIISADALLNVITGPPGEKGDEGDKGDKGDKGDTGSTGQGVPPGGTTGQALVKASDTDYDTIWSSIVAVGGLIATAITGTQNNISVSQIGLSFSTEVS